MTELKPELKKTLLSTLEERREVLRKQVQTFEGEAKIRDYKALLAQFGQVTAAIDYVNGLGFPKSAPPPRPTKPNIRYRDSGILLQLGDRLTKFERGARGRGTWIYQGPYSRMLQEFRGQYNVPGVKVIRWFKKSYRVSRHIATSYLKYATQQQTANPGKVKQRGRTDSHEL